MNRNKLSKLLIGIFSVVPLTAVIGAAQAAETLIETTQAAAPSVAEGPLIPMFPPFIGITLIIFLIVFCLNINEKNKKHLKKELYMTIGAIALTGFVYFFSVTIFGLSGVRFTFF